MITEISGNLCVMSSQFLPKRPSTQGSRRPIENHSKEQPELYTNPGSSRHFSRICDSSLSALNDGLEDFAGALREASIGAAQNTGDDGLPKFFMGGVFSEENVSN